MELSLQAADHGLIGTAGWRGLAYQYGAFWAGLLYDWQPNYVAQPWVMFLSYVLLHGGLGHLIGNMISLLVLAEIAAKFISQRAFFAIYIISAVGGGLCFGLLSSSPQPMVGASGALFGLVGAWQYWRWSARQRAGRSLWPIWNTIFWLIMLNAVLWAVLGGLLAWETHLGGFITGWIGAVALARWNSGLNR
ncbi:rhomboid family intramembrane serine protease [Pseudohalocynthiibacter sp. F2068]|uniref:rhomboid family intramembrane serine protease n=1 Tax=Pseudohalocynthiibacter sp. F2068 TaxID=2926418 RepID=UPI001FF3348C|nr:rhomboid family intramembrane serine protease [Pseudohalocynthiibacter sp. F2068]